MAGKGAFVNHGRLFSRSKPFMTKPCPIFITTHTSPHCVRLVHNAKQKKSADAFQIK
jgi:hypothetical protein